MERNFRGFLRELESEQELIRVKDELSSQFEVSAAIKFLKKKYNKAILFEKIKGYNSPVVTNLLGSKKRLAMALGAKEDGVEEAYLRRKADFIKPKIVEGGLTDEVFIEKDIDILNTIPVLTHHTKDAGPYFTSSITIARDPETGILGMGVHRIQVKDKDTVGIFLYSPPLSDFLQKAERMGQPLEIAVVNGVHPLVLMASIVKASAGTNKFEIAGGLLESPLELIKCKTVDLEVPSAAEFILEGEVLPHKREKEGPFGESTGFYFTYDNPVAKMRFIRHVKRPIYQALLPFGGEDFSLANLIWGLEHLQQLKKEFSFVSDVVFSGLNYMAIVQVEKTSNDQIKCIARHLLSNPYTKVLIAVDKDVDIYSTDEVMWAVCTRMRAAEDVYVEEGLPGMAIDPSLEREEGTDLLTSKLVIDATMPSENKDSYEKIDVPGSVKAKVSEIMAKYVTR